MKIKKAISYRIGAGKALGLLVGLLGFLLLPIFANDPSLLLRTGILLWYPMLGAMVGIFGIYATHPVMKFPMPWWFRGAILGGFMNFILTLLAYDQISELMFSMFGEQSLFSSPFWMVAEGAIICMIFDYLLTALFGDGWVDKFE